MILEPPDWTDSYYGKKKKQQKFDQIIDVPHFVDSAHVGMIQLADCVSYFLRRHIEISEGASAERYNGEAETVSKWAELALGQSISRASIYPKKGRDEASDFFYQLAPNTVLG